MEHSIESDYGHSAHLQTANGALVELPKESGELDSFVAMLRNETSHSCAQSVSLFSCGVQKNIEPRRKTKKTLYSDSQPLLRKASSALRQTILAVPKISIGQEKTGLPTSTVGWWSERSVPHAFATAA